MNADPGGILRALATLLVRGEAAPFVVGDLEEALRRDVARGMSLRRARARYLRNLLASAWNLVWLPRRRRLSGFSWLDVRLGLRMLAKYPVMTLVSGLAIAVSIAVAIGMFTLFQDFILRPIPPLPEGDRIVSLGLRTTDTNRTDRRLLHEFVAWREELETIESVSLWRAEARNIVTPDGQADLAPFAMMSASGFEVAAVPPLLGRPLLRSDEVEGAAPVVVIGYDEWTTRFESDPEIIGRQVQIDRRMHTIVGVMPEGFAFPVSHRAWLPFTDDPDASPFMASPWGYFAFGRLKTGVTLEQAEAEVNAFTARRALLHPETHAHIRSQVMPYTDTHTGMDGVSGTEMNLYRVILALLTLLVLIPFANVAILVYARTATRVGEIAVRNALGATRGRIVAQLFSEAMVLSVLAAGVGVGIVVFAQGRVEQYLEFYFRGGLPFWTKSGRDPWAIAYAAGLTILAAIVAGVVPGLQATGRSMYAAMKGANGLRLGRAWTALIVTQVAITVAALPLAGWVALQAMGMRMSRPTFVASEYLNARISRSSSQSEGNSSEGEAIAGEAIEEVVRRLEADARVTGVAFSSRMPAELFSTGFSEYARIDVDGIEPPVGEQSHDVGRMAVDAGFFAFLGVPVEVGREFVPADVEAVPPPVVVTHAFVERILDGANPIGRYVRDYRPVGEEPAPWREIIGVVSELAVNPLHPDVAESWMFTPLDRRQLSSAYLTAHVPSGPMDILPELQRIMVAVDPSLRLSPPAPLSEPIDPLRAVATAISAVIGLVLASVLFLCTAGVFALMSFNVTQRRREIGVRSALGASPNRVLVAVIGRSAKQLLVGVAVGLLIVAAVPPFSLDGLTVERDPRLVVAVALTMVLVGLLAAAGPARTGLRIQPTEALKEG